jgi:hypothetical protein
MVAFCQAVLKRGSRWASSPSTNMTCQQVVHAIKVGSWRIRCRQMDFTTPGFACRLVYKFYQGQYLVGEDIACNAKGRSFKFGYGP